MRPTTFVTKEEDGWTYQFKGAGPLRTSLPDRVRTFLRQYPDRTTNYAMHLQPYGDFSNWACSALVDLPKSSIMKLLKEFNRDGRLTEISLRIYELEGGSKKASVYIHAKGKYPGGEEE